jgi:hypothetical protein
MYKCLLVNTLMGICIVFCKKRKVTGAVGCSKFEIKNSDQYDRIYKSEPIPVALLLSALYFSFTLKAIYRPLCNVS